MTIHREAEGVNPFAAISRTQIGLGADEQVQAQQKFWTVESALTGVVGLECVVIMDLSLSEFDVCFHKVAQTQPDSLPVSSSSSSSSYSSSNSSFSSYSSSSLSYSSSSLPPPSPSSITITASSTTSTSSSISPPPVPLPSPLFASPVATASTSAGAGVQSWLPFLCGRQNGSLQVLSLVDIIAAAHPLSASATEFKLETGTVLEYVLCEMAKVQLEGGEYQPSGGRDDVFTVLFTSGSSGKPKGVLISAGGFQQGEF